MCVEWSFWEICVDKCSITMKEKMSPSRVLCILSEFSIINVNILLLKGPRTKFRFPLTDIKKTHITTWTCLALNLFVLECGKYMFFDQYQTTYDRNIFANSFHFFFTDLSCTLNDSIGKLSNKVSINKKNAKKM